MFSSNRVAARGAWIPIALLAALGCTQGPSPEMQAKIDELTTVSQERDKLVQEMAENARLLSDISAELTKVRVPPKQLRVSTESPLRASRDSMVQKIKYITARVNESDARLRESERKIRELTTLSDSLRSTLEATVTNFQTTIEAQKATIESLTDAVNQLAEQKAAMADTINMLAAQTSTVYYVIGTKDELMQRGIVTEEGGSHFLFIFGKRGKTLVPARQLDPREFTAINKREIQDIPLPEPDGEYRIASRQDLAALATRPNKDGKITGIRSLRITSPEEFWATSRFLIIVES